MTTSILDRQFLTRRPGAALNYLHIDLAVAAIVVLFAIIGAVTSDLDFLPARSAFANSSRGKAAPSAQPDAEPAATPLTASLAAALDVAVQRYRVSPEALLPVFEAAQRAGRERNLDPLLIIAVIGIESRFNPYSQSAMGAQGLMQIIPRYHQDKIRKTLGDRSLLDPVRNVEIGSQILQEAIRRQGGLMEGLQFYAGAAEDEDQTYANKVLAEKARFAQAFRRKESAS